MTTENKTVYVGELGTIIRCNMQEDISDNTALEIRARKEDGNVLIWEGELSGTNYIEYTTDEVASEFLVADIGNWKIQPWVTTADGKWPGQVDIMRVKDEFEE